MHICPTPEPTHKSWVMGWFRDQGWSARDPAVSGCSVLLSELTTAARALRAEEASYQPPNSFSPTPRELLQLWQRVWICVCVCVYMWHVHRHMYVCVYVCMHVEGIWTCAFIYECMKISNLYNTLLMEMLIHWNKNNKQFIKTNVCLILVYL